MIIRNHNFSEPKMVNATGSIEGAAVYIVMTHNSKSWYYLYVGQTKDVAQRFDQHEKWNCWLKHKQSGGLYVSVLLIPEKTQRLRVETDLRKNLLGLPCNRQ